MHLGFKTTVAENNFAHTHHFYVHYQLTFKVLNSGKLLKSKVKLRLLYCHPPQLRPATLGL